MILFKFKYNVEEYDLIYICICICICTYCNRDYFYCSLFHVESWKS